jgi:hypothetical protein
MKTSPRTTFLLLLPLFVACHNDDGDTGDDLMCPVGFSCSPASTSVTSTEPTTGVEGVSDGETSGDAPGTATSPTSPTTDPTGDSNACTLTDNQCLGADALDACGDDGKLHSITCAYICGEGRESLGCQTNDEGNDVCYCGDEVERCTDEGAKECGAANALRRCEQGVWKYYDCDASCDEGGYSGADSEQACRYDAEDDQDYCFCTYDGCPYGALRCADSGHLSFCDGDGWKTDSCEALYQSGGFSGSFGCRYFQELSGENCSCY